MILKDKKTNFKIAIKSTNSKVGLRWNDCWCKAHIYIDNYEFHHESSFEIISLNELKELVLKLKKFVDDNITQNIRISFIKNYFIIFLKSTHLSKDMTIRFVHVNGEKRNYEIVLSNDEILEFAKELEKDCLRINSEKGYLE